MKITLNDVGMHDAQVVGTGSLYCKMKTIMSNPFLYDSGSGVMHECALYHLTIELPCYIPHFFALCLPYIRF